MLDRQQQMMRQEAAMRMARIGDVLCFKVDSQSWILNAAADTIAFPSSPCFI